MAVTVTVDIATIFAWAAQNQKSLLIDNASATLVFVGVANDTTDQNALVWTVFKIILNASGLVTSVTRAVGVDFTNRATATYI